MLNNNKVLMWKLTEKSTPNGIPMTIGATIDKEGSRTMSQVSQALAMK